MRGGHTWISPVAYAHDHNFNLYYVSIPSSQHSQNVKSNNKVSVAIFDSHQLWGEGVGLQINAEISQISIKDSLKIMPIYAQRKYPYINPDHNIMQDVKAFVNKFITTGKLYRFYRITLKEVWMNNPNAQTDERIKVKL